MDIQKLLEEYDRLRKEKQRLLDDNRDKQIFIDSVLHSRAWHLANKLQSASGAAKKIVRGNKPAQESIFTANRTPEANKDYSDHKSSIKTILFYPNTIDADQIKLLKQHQIYGVCIPFAALKESGVIPSYNFCIKLNEDDIKSSSLHADLKKYLANSKYIKIASKNVVFIQENDRTTIQKLKAAGAYVVLEANILGQRIINEDVDAYYNFMPNDVDFREKSYERFVRILEEDAIYKDHLSEKPFYYSAASETSSVADYSPAMFYNWVRLIMEKMQNAKEKLLLVNVNENFLNNGVDDDYANINALSKAILNYPFSDEAVIINNSSVQSKKPGKVALQAHIYYADLAPEVFDYLKNIHFNFDLFISTDTAAKKLEIEAALSNVKLNCSHIKIEIIENRGRDIYPFIKQISPVYNNYDFIGHIHTKKTVEHGFGDEWRKYLYDQLLLHTEQVFGLFSNQTTGSVFPATYEKISHAISIGNNQRNVNKLLGRMNLAKFSSGDKIIFPAGSMFWARKEAIAKLFEIGLSEKDFSNEIGQIDGTTAHAIERLFGIIPEKSGYKNVQYYFED